MKPCILIVEDDIGSKIVLEKGLRSKGYAVRSASHGEEALLELAKTPVNLVISDIMMPTMDGYELCRRMKANPHWTDIPFLFYTATFLGEDEEQLGLSLGAIKYLVKPMDLDDLSVIVASILEGHAMPPHSHTQPPMSENRSKDMYSKVLSKKLEKKVNELEKERQKLLTSESKFRHLVEDLRRDYFLYQRNTDGVYTYITPSISDILGYSIEDFSAHYHAYYTDEPCNHDAEKHFALALTGKEQATYAVQWRHAKASSHDFEITEHPVLDEQGRVIAVEGIAHDVTAYKELERQFLQAQKMEAVGTLAGGIAHDFNNMLAGIGGNIYLAQSQIKKGHATKALDKLSSIEMLVQQAAALVSQLLAFSRKKNPEMSEVFINGFVKESLKLARVTIPEDIQLTSDITSESLFIQGDMSQLQQILINLLNNARDALENSPKPCITISLKSFTPDASFIQRHADSVDKTFAHLMVHDNGSGISQKDIHRIFDPFFTTKEVGRGTGLGLSMVFTAIRHHSGIIDVESEVGVGGTTFHAYFPRLESPNPIIQSDIQTEVIPSKGETILLADDDEVVRTTTAEVLDTLGYQVIQAEDGLKALEALNTHKQHIAIALLDVVMPHLSGLPLAQKVREIAPELPIIFVTGYDKNDQLHKNKALPNSSILIKPVGFDAMHHAIQALL